MDLSVTEQSGQMFTIIFSKYCQKAAVKILIFSVTSLSFRNNRIGSFSLGNWQLKLT